MLFSTPRVEKIWPLLGILTGLRVGKTLGLRWKDLDFALAQLRVVRQGGDDLVFSDPERHAVQRYQPVAAGAETGGQKVRAPWLNWHTLRRTHATLLQAAGGSLKDAQAQLGHSQLSTTLQVYTLPLPAHQRAAVDKLAQLVTNGDEFATDAKAVDTPVLSIQ